MSLHLVNANIVIVARHFNPSVINQLWLVENEIVAREAFLPGCVFTDMFANVITGEFNLFVAQEQLQFVPQGPTQGHARIVVDVIGRLVETLPHTPFTAIGLNVTWHITPVEDFGRFSRSLFFSERLALCQAFDVEGARFGGYFSRDALGCRMKLDVKPVLMTTAEEQAERMQFAFNFHREVAGGENPVQKIRELLGRWDEAVELSSDLMNKVVGANACVPF